MKNVSLYLLAFVLLVSTVFTPDDSAATVTIPVFSGTVRLTTDQLADYNVTVQGNILSGGALIWPKGMVGQWNITNSANTTIAVGYGGQAIPVSIVSGATQLIYGNGSALFAASGGSVTSAQMPAFTGDMTTSAGSTVATVNTIGGVTPGSAAFQPVATFLQAAYNLGDLIDITAARAHLGLAFPSSSNVMGGPNCVGFASVAACEYAMGYVDPRLHGANCTASGATPFNSNNNVGDDAPGIQAAMNSGNSNNILIPSPGCKVASNINTPRSGISFFSFAGGGGYDPNNHPTNPYLFITNDIATTANTAGNPNLNYAIDQRGWDALSFHNITMRANYSLEGTVAITNSVGIQGGLEAAFIIVDGLSIGNMGNGIGGSMLSVGGAGSPTACSPVGTLQNNVYQIKGHGLVVANSCYGIYANESDVHLDDAYFAGEFNQGFSTIPGYAGEISLSNIRCEYSGNASGGAANLQNNGSCMWFDSPTGTSLSNVTCDHSYGPCLDFGTSAKNVLLSNIRSYDADWGGTNVPASARCHYLIEGGSSYSASGMQAIRSGVSTPYTLCLTGTPDYITWKDPNGSAGTGGLAGGGWTTAYLNNLAAPMAHFDFDVLGQPKQKPLDSWVFGSGAIKTTSSFDLSQFTKALTPPNFATSSRPACTNPGDGSQYYDTTTNLLMQCTGTSATWTQVGGGSAVSITSLSPSIVATPSPITGTGTLNAYQAINDQGAATSYTILAGDGTKEVKHSATSAVAVTLPVATATGFGAGFAYSETNNGSSIVTITPTTSTINGDAALSLFTGESAYIFSDGTNYFAFLGRSGLVDSGTKFTTSGCSVSATAGGRATGTYTSGTSGTCTVVVTMRGASGMTAPTGWDCHATDRTTVADSISQTASSATTATLSGTTVSGDVIGFTCRGY